MQARAEKLGSIRMTEELSGVTYVIIIGLGVLTLILLFLFGKRQIMRFALRSRRSPHVPIGYGGPKALKLEIERRIAAIPKIICEPKLITKEDPRYIVTPGQQIPIHYYRLKAVDDVKTLEEAINAKRHPSENLRAYLLTTLAAPLNGSGQRLIHQFCDLYEHARHDPNHFGDEEYQQYNRLLMKLIDAAKLIKFNNTRTPNRPPKKQKHEKNRNLLDPTRLHPLPPNFTNQEDEIISVDSRPTSLAIPVLSSDNETSV
ncbi:protein C1orf43 homolog [Coccinella septempunctata]|uniref:protein C1orf43 homolog n=1 Tax=Coccinella septempunctata TaxID=41139 RepID=UPI001D06D4D0|nr:protein C1orf43 homolog [Coccinella septempunctata]